MRSLQATPRSTSLAQRRDRAFIQDGVAIEDAADSPKPFRALWDRRHQTRTRTKRDSRTNDATFVTLANVVT
jgi:hypothetical protein